jgi:hypothetical protein
MCEALLRQLPRIVANLELEISDMVRRNDYLELGDSASCIHSMQVTRGIVALDTTGWIPTDSMKVLRVLVTSEAMHRARPTSDRVISIHIPRLRNRHAAMAMRHRYSGGQNEGSDTPEGSPAHPHHADEGERAAQ